MNRRTEYALIAAFGATLHAQTINLNGRVSDSAGKPVANAVVELVRQGLRDTTGSDGAYSIIKLSASTQPVPATHAGNIRLDESVLEFALSQPSPVKIEVFDLRGNVKKRELLSDAQAGTYRFDIAPNPLSNQMLIVKASIGAFVQTFRYFPLQKVSEGNLTTTGPGSAGGVAARTLATVDTLKVSAVGYLTSKIDLASYASTVNVTLAADATAVYNPCPTNGAPCKILPFGDSITEGVKSTDGAGYRSQLFKLIVAAKQKVAFVGSLSDGPTTVSSVTFPRAHEGHAGWTIDPGYSEYSGYGGISSLVPSPALNGGPQIILLHIGANDLFPKDRETMSTRLDALVEKIAKNVPNALIVLAQITPVGTANGSHTQAQVDAANAAQAVYNSKIPGIIQAHAAKGQHIIGVDMSKMPLSDLTTASLHPNDKGYSYMANIWYAAIKDLLPK